MVDPSADINGTDTFLIDGTPAATVSVGASGTAAFATSALSVGLKGRKLPTKKPEEPKEIQEVLNKRKSEKK